VQVQAVAEELGQALAVERAAAAAAFVELVHHAPGATTIERRVVAIGDAQVRIAQAVAGKVLPGAGDERHSGTIALHHVVELAGDAGGQGEVAVDRIEGGPPRFAVLAGQRRGGEAGQRQRRQGGAQDAPDLAEGIHHRILSL
jgi:hypothetical protein